jgi:NMD protein affecting ribosome stability and mRNA decay
VKKKSGREVIRKNTQPRIQNPYQERERDKYPDGTGCPECGAVFVKGKWTWSKPPAGGRVPPELCPACQQIKADYAGGILTLSGSFVAAHREDVLNRVRNVEREEKKDHPLQRIMKIVDKGEEIEIRTTSEHLMARMGKALKSDFSGELELTFIEDENFARAHWRRNS